MRRPVYLLEIDFDYLFLWGFYRLMNCTSGYKAGSMIHF